MEVWVVIGLIVAFYLYRSSKNNKDAQAKHGRQRRSSSDQSGGAPEIVVEVVTPRREVERQVVETLTETGVPAFKYRFRAHLEFNTPAQSLQNHRAVEFIERPNGNRDIIEADGGYWYPVSEWEQPDRAYRDEDERFKYIGGAQAYIDFLLSIRAIYEDISRSPQSKRDAIRKFCEDNHSVYTVRNVCRPPWESLIVPVLSLAEGFGPHRVGLMDGAGIRSIYDVESRSDKELLEIKGIGKAAVSALRNLVSHWPYDKFTDCIEADEAYRSKPIA